MCSIWSRWSYTSETSGNTMFLCELLRKFLILTQIFHHRSHRVLDVHGGCCENSLDHDGLLLYPLYSGPTKLFIFSKRNMFFGERSCESSPDSELKACTPQFPCLLSTSHKNQCSCQRFITTVTREPETIEWHGSVCLVEERKYISHPNRSRHSVCTNLGETRCHQAL